MSQTINVEDIKVEINLPITTQIIDVGDDVQVEVLEINPVLSINDYPIDIDVQGNGLVPITNNLTFIAGQNLSALRAVTSNALGQAVYASNATLADAQVIGVTYTAANTGSQVTVISSGLFTDPSWNWVKGPVFLGTSGMLTQVAPTGGAILVYVGRALTTTQLLIDVDITITTT